MLLMIPVHWQWMMLHQRKELRCSDGGSDGGQGQTGGQEPLIPKYHPSKCAQVCPDRPWHSAQVCLDIPPTLRRSAWTQPNFCPDTTNKPALAFANAGQR